MNSLPVTEVGVLQATIDQLVASLRAAGCRLDVHHDLSAYRVICESQGLWRDPAFMLKDKGAMNGQFWLGFSNEREQLVALAAGRSIETKNFHHMIETGKLWHVGGFDEQPGGTIARVDAMPPTRNLSGSVSYLQFQMLERGSDLPELGWMVSWLSQALAFRFHRSRFAVSLVQSGSGGGSSAARESFARSEFCLSGYFPPMEAAATLHLCHTSLEEFLAWGRRIAPTIPEAIVAHQLEPVPAYAAG